MMGINLLPKELKEERQKARTSSKVFLVCFSILIIFLLGIATLEAANQILTLNLATYQNQVQLEENEIAKFSDIEEKTKKLNENLAILDELKKGQASWSNLLKEIAVSTPAGLQIGNLTMNTKKTPNFNASGSANSYREIIKFKEKLESSNSFKEVVLTSASKMGTDKEVYSFNLNFNLESEK